jgi:hypothetical protein
VSLVQRRGGPGGGGQPGPQRARPAIEVAGRSVKRYHVTPGPDGVEPEIERASFAILPRLLPAPDGTPSATFIVMHRSRGDNAAYLNAYSWVWDNVQR